MFGESKLLSRGNELFLKQTKKRISFEHKNILYVTL